MECGNREDLSPVIVYYADKVDLVAVGGGDGTLNAAALGVIEAGLPLGILPMGTANDLARTLGIAPDISTAARIIAAGDTRADRSRPRRTASRSSTWRASACRPNWRSN